MQSINQIIQLLPLDPPGQGRYQILCGHTHAGGITVYPQGRSFSYGIAIARERRRQGIAKQALSMLFSQLSDLGFQEAVARIKPENRASLALHRSLGFSLLKEGDVLTFHKILTLNEEESFPMSLYDELLSGTASLSLVGLGYVGMPIAVAFAHHVPVIGFDLNKEKIALYKKGIDPTREVGDKAIAETKVQFTDDPAMLRRARFHIVAVPTPVNQDKTPDLSPVESASRILGQNLVPGSIVVFESTVYPGVTEDICVPILERESGLKCGIDFKVGYSPERINPGDRVHTLATIRKIVSGMDEESLAEIQNVYNLVIQAGTYPVSSIKTAEAVKVVENSQRDINIAFMNELAMVFDRMGIDTNEVIDGMNTKWNALGFRPGLVGGHCIGVDPYYFTYEAEKLGYHSQIILSGRKVNDGMGAFVADAAIKQLVLAGKVVRSARVAIFGLTFKENCPDTRNSKVEDILSRLREYGISPLVTDPWAAPEEALREYGVELTPFSALRDLDCIILAVAHREFRELGLDGLSPLFRQMPNEEKIFIDVKGLLPMDRLKKEGYRFWRL